MKAEFAVDGLTLIGDLRVPDGAGPRPGLVFTGPFTGVRDQVTGLYAARLAERGYVTLSFDHRNWGESGGQPRRHEDPQGKLHDLRAAVSWLRSRPEVNAEPVGVVGICLGGGYALKFAAFDPRVRVFVGIAGAYANPYAMRTGMDYQAALGSYTEVLELQDQGGPVTYMPAVAEGGESAMPGDEPYAYYGTARGASPHWVNEVTRASVRELITMDHMMGADFLSPKPALIVHGIVDRFCSPEGAEEVYKRLDEPKELVWVDAKRHIDLYDQEPYVTRAVDATAAFLEARL
ncbi:alpha/beta hydrolase [Nonomuraea sp. KC401]|uniref:alpha/beta hydrolase n=1 Tax=unclassified Nonomuraea TaxID=2593643 RepID=UPI0010FDEC37|nr:MULTISPECIES: alpha/beta hydrolase [unclassified Nonomuraea]NBE96321.1 alpha/beta hydrolase [Nonomuraea sp. K271]TLF68750.1 alpha/beta hydrolase [Nonomuraea sp. KC401]